MGEPATNCHREVTVCGSRQRAQPSGIYEAACDSKMSAVAVTGASKLHKTAVRDEHPVKFQQGGVDAALLTGCM